MFRSEPFNIINKQGIDSMEFMLGGIIQFGGDFSPKDWSFCQGQTLSISQNQALFAILGITFGGDGRTTFALPDLRSRVPIGTGHAPGLTAAVLGRTVGTEKNKLDVSQMPAHTHTSTFTGTGRSAEGTIKAATNTEIRVTAEEGDTNNPTNGYLALGINGKNGINIYKQSTASTSTLNSSAVSSTTTVTGDSGGITGGTIAIDSAGGNQLFSIMQPSLGMNFIISMQGFFPSRN